ncbi:MAG: PfkB family carbohydrate kinase [Propionibacteriaceae bacterium]|jgi:fructokinase|nr:PfkB family carbohydrate kinase [Propionibacteriaceae bacterium]
MMRCVSCGEALIDLVRQSGGTSAASPWLGLSAGGPFNTAVGLARLGVETALLTRLGSDGLADQLADHLAANGVDLSLCPRVDQPTPLAVVSLDRLGRASYAFHFAQTAAFGWHPQELPAPDPQAWLHLASIAWVVEPGATALRAWLEAGAEGWGGLSYDLNVRPTVLADPRRYWATVEPLLTAVGRAGGVIKASDEDLSFLAPATGATGDVAAVAAHWMDRFRPAAVIVTLGADGALAVDRSGEVVRAPGRRVPVVDTVGAGDSFMAGFLERRLRQLDASGAADLGPETLAAALARGTAAAALTCQRPGADPPTAAEIDAAG